MTEIHTLSPEYAALVRRAHAARAAYQRATGLRFLAWVKSWGRSRAAGPLAGANA